MLTSSSLWSAGALLAAVHAAFAQCPGERIHSPLRWHDAKFGDGVQIEGDVAVVGDRADHTFCGGKVCFNGAVHMFRRVDGAWEFEETIFHSRISAREGGLGDVFGAAIASETHRRFAANAPGEDVVEPDTGAVYVFEHDGEAWREVAEVLPVEPIWNSGFGMTLALQGDTLVVGQPKYSVAYIYRERNGRWEFAQKIAPPDPHIGMRFGMGMALDGEWLAMGAPWDDRPGSIAGSAYLFRRSAGGDFEFFQKLDAPRPGEFGYSVALDGDTMAIGAPRANGVFEALGAIFIYEFDGAQWRLTSELQHDDPADRNERLGWSVTLKGDLVISGARSQEVPGVGRGAAYVFQRRPDGSWRQAAKLLADPATPGDWTFDFGWAVHTDGASVIVGAPGATVGGAPDTGAAHIYDLPCLLCRADLDGDGELTFFDFLAFQNEFAAGCA